LDKSLYSWTKNSIRESISCSFRH